MMSENPTNRDRSRCQGTLSPLPGFSWVRDGHVKTVQYAGTQSVSDALTEFGMF
jgi:hypothetical protein